MGYFIYFKTSILGRVMWSSFNLLENMELGREKKFYFLKIQINRKQNDYF